MLRGLIHGAGHIALWLWSGARPVDRFLAGERASRCGNCPMNVAGRVGFASSVGGVIAKMMGLRSPKPSLAGRLGTCSGCGCNLRLKVWVPLRGTEDTSRLHKCCWVRQELE
jgi:hypothetical protein